jgi:hypothetical protein
MRKTKKLRQVKKTKLAKLKRKMVKVSMINLITKKTRVARISSKGLRSMMMKMSSYPEVIHVVEEGVEIETEEDVVWIQREAKANLCTKLRSSTDT